jgi:hypothetical protein
MADLTAADGAFVLEDDDVAGGARYAYRFSRGSSRDRVYSPILWVDVPASETVPATPRIARIAPSPTSGSATIRFAVPAGGRVSLAVIDVRGRLVRRLEGGEVPRGWHSIEWDGNSGAGSAAPSGIYFVRLDAMGAHAMERIVLVR